MLQHPRERDVAIGTARMASLCLPNATLHVGMHWDDSAELAALLADPARPPILLYPGPGARDVQRDPPPGPVTLVVVDGTWSHAKNVVRDNAVLAALPRYAFTPATPSEYRIRREPSETCVSTIEALATVLGALEGDPATFAAMLAPFRAMVDAHLEARATRRSRETPRRKQRPARPLTAPDLELMRDRWDDVVCVAAEANAWRYVDGRDRASDELLHLVAVRPSTGEVLDALARPSGALAPSTAFHLLLDEAELVAAPPAAALVADVQRMARRTDIWCGWGYYPLALARAAGLPEPQHYIDVRSLAQRLGRGQKIGMLEAFVERTLGPDVAAAGRGRAGARAGALAGLAVRWRGQ